MRHAGLQQINLIKREEYVNGSLADIKDLRKVVEKPSNKL